MVVGSGKAEERKREVLNSVSPGYAFCKALEKLLHVKISADQLSAVYELLGEYEEAQFLLFGIRNKSKEVPT